MRWIVVAVGGVALGVVTAASDTAAGGLDQTGWSRALGMVLNAGVVSAGAAVLAGWVVRRAGRSAGALAGFAVLVCAVVGYYAYGVTLGDRAGLGMAALSGVIRWWLVASVVAGPLLGTAGVLARRADLWGLAARLVVPGGALVEMVVLRRLGAETFRVDPALAWAQALIVVAALLGAAWAVLALVDRLALPRPRTPPRWRRRTPPPRSRRGPSSGRPDPAVRTAD